MDRKMKGISSRGERCQSGSTFMSQERSAHGAGKIENCFAGRAGLPLRMLALQIFSLFIKKSKGQDKQSYALEEKRSHMHERLTKKQQQKNNNKKP